MRNYPPPAPEDCPVKATGRQGRNIFILVIAALVIGTAIPYAELVGEPEKTKDMWSEVSLDEEPF